MPMESLSTYPPFQPEESPLPQALGCLAVSNRLLTKNQSPSRWFAAIPIPRSLLAANLFPLLPLFTPASPSPSSSSFFLFLLHHHPYHRHYNYQVQHKLQDIIYHITAHQSREWIKLYNQVHGYQVYARQGYGEPDDGEPSPTDTPKAFDGYTYNHRYSPPEHRRKTPDYDEAPMSLDIYTSTIM